MTKKIEQYLSENIEVAKDIAREINSWDGSLEYLDVHENDEDFFNTYFESNPNEAVRSVCYGDYNYMDEYVKFNGLGNLESLSEYDYDNMINDHIDEIAELLIDNIGNVHIYDEGLQELVDEI